MLSNSWLSLVQKSRFLITSLASICISPHKYIGWIVRGFFIICKEPNLGIHFRSSTFHKLYGYTNADWASNINDRCSTRGYCVYLGDNLVYWATKKQQFVSRSSTESEYKALANGAVEVARVQSLLDELHMKPVQALLLWCDNMGQGSLASNLVFHAWTKHIEIDFLFAFQAKLKNSNLAWGGMLGIKLVRADINNCVDL